MSVLSALSVWIDGVRVGVGSTSTWCHSICVVCDPVVTHDLDELVFVSPWNLMSV